MAVAPVGAASDYQSAQITTAATTWVTGTRTAGMTIAAGDLLWAHVSFNGVETSTVAAPAGWTTAQAPTVTGGGNVGAASFWKLATASEPTTYTFTPGASARGSVLIRAYRGVDQTTPIDAGPVVTTGQTPTTAATDFPVGGLTTTTDRAFIASGCTIFASTSGVLTPPTGTTQIATLSGRRTTFVEKGAQSVAGASVTLNYQLDLTNLAYSGYQVAFRVGATDTTPPTVPANLHTTAVASTAVTLAWTASTDASGIAAYEVIVTGP